MSGPRDSKSSWPRLSAGGAFSARTARSASRGGPGAQARRQSTLPRGLVTGRLLRGAGLAGLAGLAALGVVQVASWVESSRALPVRSVVVRGDGIEQQEARMEELRAYAGVELGAPLFGVDIDAVAARVSEHPYVGTAAVRRVPPDAIEIQVQLRTPHALLAADHLYLLDGAGQVMKAARVGDGLDLPVVTGVRAEDVASGAAAPTLAAAASLLAAHDAAGAPGGAASEVNFIAGIGFELVLDDGTRVRVGDDAQDGMGLKLARLDAVVRRLSQEGRRASFIYLDDERRPERASVRLRPVAETPRAGG